MPTQADAMMYAIKAANNAGVDPNVFLGLVQAESSWNPFAQPKNKDGSLQSSAFGYTQLLKGTAAEVGVDRTNWMANLDGGAKYLAKQIKAMGGNVSLGVAAYHDGAGSVKKNGVSAVADDYRKKIADYANQFRQSGITGGAVSKDAAIFSGGLFSSANNALSGLGGSLSGIDKAIGDATDEARAGLTPPSFSDLIPRLALIIFAFIFIAAGVFMIAPKSVTNIAGKVPLPIPV